MEILDTTIKLEQEIKSIQIGKKDIKLLLYADNMILYIENPKNFTQKLPELVNKFSKVAGYKISMKKWSPFLYINSELSERESKKKKKVKI